LSILAGVLFALALPSVAGAAEPCPNEQLRQASDSTQLPDCRAYELVSPADAGGAVGDFPLNEASAAFLQVGLGPEYTARTDGLFRQLAGAVDVQGNGEDVFWNSTATPPGTGAIVDAGAWDAFHSVRTSAGWSTQDLLPSGQQIPHNPGGSVKVILGASADGSSALVLAQQALYPSAFANPQQAALGEWHGFSVYRVSTDGAFAPQMVTHGEFLLPENNALESLTNTGPFQLLSASPDLSVVTFRSTIALESPDDCTRGLYVSGYSEATTYLWNASLVDGLAHVIIPFVTDQCTAPNVNDVSAVLPDGHPILMPNTANISTPGPLVENTSKNKLERSGLTPLAGASGGTLLSFTSDGATAYVQASEALDANFPSAGAGNIYAVSTTLGSASEGGVTPGVRCVSCASDQTDVTYVTTSGDGAHVLFTTDQGLWEWDAVSGAQLLTPTPVTDLGPSTVIVSENGQYAVGLTRQLAQNPNGTADLYEFSAGRQPTLITSGTSADSYTLVAGGPIAGVSNDGRRVVYDTQPHNVAPGVIDEWNAGQITQISPAGSLYAYFVQTVAGDELQNVFFIARDALVPWDFNAGQTDIYDARAGGGFTFCTPGNPGPPPGVERCGATTSNANPTVPSTPGYAANLATASFQLASLPTDTSQPVSPSTPKALTRAQKLAKTLKACKKKPKKQRTACERQARKQYSANPGKRSKKGGK
jgi:hypothetical protein